MNINEIKNIFTGPMELFPTTFDKNDKIDYDKTKKIMNYMISKGIKKGQAHILIQGAFGQFYCMSIEERKEHAEKCVEIANGRVPIIVGCQEIYTEKVIELVKHAEKIGADGVQVSPPYYHHNLRQKDVFDFFAEISDKTSIPIEAYNNYWSTVGISVDTLEKMANELENVVASKWASPTRYDNVQGYKRCADKMALIDNAYSFNLTLGHQLGATGFITHIGTFWPEYDIEIWNLLKEQKYAQASTKMLKFFEPIYAFAHEECPGGGANLNTVCMELVGLPSYEFRRPAPTLTNEQKSKLKNLFDEAGVPKADV